MSRHLTKEQYNPSSLGEHTIDGKKRVVYEGPLPDLSGTWYYYWGDDGMGTKVRMAVRENDIRRILLANSYKERQESFGFM